MAVMKVKPWGEEQGPFVLIEEEDFNPDFHKVFTDAELKKLDAAEAKKAQASDDAAAEDVAE